MYPEELVFGVLATSERVAEHGLAERWRSYTIAWSRYGYHGPLVEAANVNAALDRALERGYR